MAELKKKVLKKRVKPLNNGAKFLKVVGLVSGFVVQIV